MLKVLDIRKDLAKFWHPPIPLRKVPFQGIVVHSTGDEDVVKLSQADDVYKIAGYDTGTENHVTPGRPLPTITYTHYIEYDHHGSLVCWRTLDDNVRTSHAGDVLYKKYGWNHLFTSVVVDHSPQDAPDPKKMSMLYDLVAYRCLQYGWDPLELITEQDEQVPRVVFHRELKGSGWYYDAKGRKALRKECPDHAWDPDEFRRIICGRIVDIIDPFKSALASVGFVYRGYKDLVVDGSAHLLIEGAKKRLGLPAEELLFEGVITEPLMLKLCELFKESLNVDFFI